MAHYRCEEKAGSDLTTAYVHSPSDLSLSFQDYLEDLFSQGWELASVNSRGSDSSWMFTFRANSQ